MSQINFKNLGKAILLIFLCIIVIPLIVSIIISPFLNINDNNNLIIINLIVYLIEIILLFLIYHKDLKKEWLDFRKDFKSYCKIALKCWLKAFLLMIVFNTIIILILGKMANNESANRELLNNLPIFSIFMMVFLGPIMEEIIFRKGFKNAFKNKKLFLIVTAFIFGLFHVISNLNFTSFSDFLISSTELLYILPYGAMGYFFGKAYYETDCIFTSITTHMFHNGLSIAIILLSTFI